MSSKNSDSDPYAGSTRASKPKDDIYATPLGNIVDFQFDEKVVGVFSDMINRSVPGYSTIIKSLGILAAGYAQEDSRCYDLGCSLGAATLSLLQQVKTQNCRFVAVDNSSAMIQRCREHIQVAGFDDDVDLVCGDIRDINIKNASVVMMNFTLQFVPPKDRMSLIKKIYQGLKPGGVLLLSEKISFDDKQLDSQLIEWYHDFKRANGYSELEISQKRAALEKVMIPESLDCHRQRLTEAGFNRVNQWFQCFNFASMVAVK
ncbi:carboxy-S-adenosyl-L-methionine synthase CmoA [Motiliproteus sp. MSK22-1]|uniref:carboxy-S-adenosyl-L-methionine synthase CmoA n=1 Tax=Motiliproteus sp. MSK22-1 TaxID=1897630 RepID=UPI000975F1D1|nr:carboxy-S-adenosyl-L-methionine synthase CmoA [Motiliproteus sp. MSK22-1]OMH36565.1 carboxy-S-adenosyl-L-methionine synthase CmoA [Motiliproteus sp. MSK22-1]